MLYLQRLDDHTTSRDSRSDRGNQIAGRERIEELHCIDALHQFRTCASSGNNRGLLPRLVPGIYCVGNFVFISTRPNSGIRAIASGFRPEIAHMRYAGGIRLDLVAVLVVDL